MFVYLLNQSENEYPLGKKLQKVLLVFLSKL